MNTVYKLKIKNGKKHIKTYAVKLNENNDHSKFIDCKGNVIFSQTIRSAKKIKIVA